MPLPSEAGPLPALSRRAGLTAGILAGLLAAVVMAGWHLENARIVQIHPAFAPMQYNTALCFLLAGISLALAARGHAGAARGACAAAGFLAGVTLLQYPFGADFGIDRLFMEPFTTTRTSHPGRMSLITGFCFLLASAALCVWNRRKTGARAVYAAGLTFAVGLALALSVMIGYLAGIDSLLAWGQLTRMAVHTSAIFILLFTGGLFLCLPEAGARLPVAVTVLTGTTLSLLLVSLYQEQEAVKVRHAFERTARTHADTLERDMRTGLSMLASLQAFFNASVRVDRDEFRTFTTGILANQSSLQAFEWAPRVPGPDRSAFEETIRNEGFPDFRITERDPSGRSVPAGERDLYDPVLYVEPAGENAPALGFDLRSSPERRAALEAARDTGRVFATPPVPLLHDADVFGFLAFLPVYRKGAPLDGVPERRAALEGFVVGVYRIDRLVPPLDPSGLRLVLEDMTERQAPRLVHASDNGQAPLSSLMAPLELATEVGGRRWGFRYTPGPGAPAETSFRFAWLFLAFGFAATVAGALYFHRAVDRRERIEHLVGERTSELRAREQESRRIVESAIEAFVSIDAEGRVVDWNPQAEKTFGWSRSEILGRRIDETIIPTTHREAHRAGIRRFLATGEGPVLDRRIELPALHRDGREFPVELTIWPVPGEQGIRFNAFLHDITERKRAEAEILDGKAFLDSLVENIPNMIFVKEAEDLRFVRFNKAGEDLLGVSREQLKGKNDHDFFPKEQADFFTGKDREVLAGKKVVDIPEEPIQTPRGERILHTRKVPILDAAGKPRFLLGISEDITERHHLDKAQHAAKEAAEAANRTKSEFLANMSHEIRTPMNAIVGVADLLSETPLTPEQKRHVEIFRNAGENLLTLINDILDISKVEAGQMSLETVGFDLHDLARKTSEFLAIRAHRKGLELVCHVLPDVPRFVRGDPHRLRQILTNLLGNAVKFTEKGEVVLRVERRVDASSALRFTVTDTGIGIPEDKIPTLFQAFSQVDASTTRQYGGTGLGLAISRRLVEMMGGSINVESRPGAGSAFSFSVPLPEETVPPATGEEALLDLAGPAAAEPGTAPARPLRVLLAEDIEDNRTLIASFLARTPHTLDFAENGQAALDKFRTGRYDLVLMDIQMPVMDGLAATRAIREIERAERRPPVPVIALTAHAMQEDIARSLAAGCNFHVTKPVRKMDLVEAICRYAEGAPSPLDEGRPGDAIRVQVDPDLAPMIPKFLENRRREIAEIRKALAAGDFEAIRARGHGMKGVGGGYGFARITEIGGAIEEAARLRNAAAVSFQADALADYLSRVEVIGPA